METNHRKGEWKYSLEPYAGNYVILDTNTCIAECRKESNAKLISAAPDLLAALEVCYASLCTYGSHPIIQQQVEKALLKATE
jgi:hypothetical protein